MQEEHRATGGRLLRRAVSFWLIACAGAVPGICWAMDGKPPFSPFSDTGLYLWRDWQGGWQVRVLAAAGNQRVVGSFHTEQRVSSARRVALESADVLRVSSDHTVQFDLATARRTIDGLALSAGSRGVCLRTTSSLPIFLGRDARRATSPVDLTGTGACATAMPAESALVVSRTSAVDWQVRLASAAGWAAFDGRFEFTTPLERLQRHSIEAADRVFQPAADVLKLHLEVWPGGHDTVRFTTPEGSRICLRSTSGREQIVSLVSVGQHEPLRVRTPVDLTNTGGCGPPADPFPPPAYGRKFHPGHYVVLTPRDDELSLAESIVHGVRGFSKRYLWRQLEPTPGNYDFSDIEADLHLISGHALQLVVLIADKTFDDTLPIPDYLLSRTVPNNAGGYTVVRWDPYVVTRYKALIAALGKRFDAHPSFEGMATEETAPGLPEAVLDATGYTPEGYRNVLIDVLSSASRSLPRSRVFWTMNFMWEGNHYMGEIARRVAPLGVVMGGPDVMPDSFALQWHPYPFYDGAVGHMPLFSQVEPACYHHPHADPFYPTTYWTPEELFTFARDELHVSYMFWVRWRWHLHRDSFNWWDAIPVIGNHPTFNR